MYICALSTMVINVYVVGIDMAFDLSVPEKLTIIHW